jgi:hypothetical protein
MAKSRPLSPREVRAVWEPFLRDGTIDEVTYQRLVAARRYTPVAEIDRAIAESAGDPRIQRLYRALEVKNNELWNELAAVFYGQADRSNLQRLLNHPLLYWPISYQIKATRWLANVLFDRALGVDTGAGGAWTIQQVHDDHLRRMATDPEYAQFFADNKTLLFMAQMILPITPFDIGVSMSPWARLVLEGMANNEDPTYTEPYSRNIFSVGPGYTYFVLLPRFVAEQGKPGAALGGFFGQGGPLSDTQRYLPSTIPVRPSRRSTLDTLSVDVMAGTPVGVDLSRNQPAGQSRYAP